MNGKFNIIKRHKNQEVLNFNDDGKPEGHGESASFLMVIAIHSHPSSPQSAFISRLLTLFTSVS